ncbi:PhzF family phenazine biosynthesis protein [Pararhodonellum marinum]|uniref:PhzF family phenazine biosynthesis protein n=1 Tax=Pararhodonellum marinum TaxID=2755358 RepID=UPI00188FA17C|nr:PhzF family phenazine biosynthesis protein [Pararhodonellum marinum]
MKSKLDYQIISVFTDQDLGYKGNPAACIYLENPLSEKQMKDIAIQLDQPATSFIWKELPDTETFRVRWFAPDKEIQLCGHGGAATGLFLAKRYPSLKSIQLQYNQGVFTIELPNDTQFELTLEAIPVTREISVPESIKKGLGIELLGLFETGNKHIVWATHEHEIMDMKPDFELLRQCSIFGYAITAAGREVDFVSRTLIPHTLQLEDYATGSSHAALIPFWAEKLKKIYLKARQYSSRGGFFEGELKDNLVKLTGKFAWEAEGQVAIPKNT